MRSDVPWDRSGREGLATLTDLRIVVRVDPEVGQHYVSCAQRIAFRWLRLRAALVKPPSTLPPRTAPRRPEPDER